jgi:hypothetical protein
VPPNYRKDEGKPPSINEAIIVFTVSRLDCRWDKRGGATGHVRAPSFDLRRLARAVHLEKLSALSLSHVENSKNLDVMSER